MFLKFCPRLSVFRPFYIRLQPIQRRNYCGTSIGFLRPNEVDKLAFNLRDDRISTLLAKFRSHAAASSQVSSRSDDYLDFLQRVTRIEDEIADIDRQIAELRTGFPDCSHQSTDAQFKIVPTDSELAKLVEEDLTTFENNRRRLENNLLSEIAVWLLWGRGEAEREQPRDLILEVSSGVGGQEAMLFTKEIFDMYRRHAAHRNWKFDILEEKATDLDGLHFATAAISGEDAYVRLRFEGGVHRVQRVPATERNGRVHTSTMSVAVMAQPPPNDDVVKVNLKEYRFEYFRASAPGGQNVNKSDTGCRVTHIPTGIVVSCQMERKADINREWALRRISAILYERRVDAQLNATRRARKLQVGSLARSEKIRTYNYPQDRITDHRTKHSFLGIPDTLAGGDGLDRVIQSVLRFHLDERLSEALDEEVRKANENESVINATKNSN